MTDNSQIKDIIKPNPDKEMYDEITAAVKDCDGYCCCETERNEDTKCMCKNFREQEDGFCHCSRFYKVKDFPIITILCHPDDSAEATNIAESFSAQGFIVLTPMTYKGLFYNEHKKVFDELQRTKIHKADVVFVMNNSEAAIEFLEEEIYWAEDLKKKIVYQYTEEVKEDEVRTDASI